MSRKAGEAERLVSCITKNLLLFLLSAMWFVIQVFLNVTVMQQQIASVNFIYSQQALEVHVLLVAF